MKPYEWLDLQRFAEGSADAGEGADPGQQPQAPTGNTGSDTPGRMTWEQILQDPEYNAKLQRIVQDRLKSARSAQERLKTLEPALQALARQHGLDPEQPDDASLVKAITENQSRSTQQRQQRQAFLRRHLDGLMEQAKALQRVFPDFSLEQELKDPMFARLTGPAVNLPLEDAYYALRRDRFQAATAQVTASATARKLSNAIAAAARRPVENGASGAGASLSQGLAPSQAQRAALKQRIRQAAARGEKVYPGI